MIVLLQWCLCCSISSITRTSDFVRGETLHNQFKLQKGSWPHYFHQSHRSSNAPTSGTSQRTHWFSWAGCVYYYLVTSMFLVQEWAFRTSISWCVSLKKGILHIRHSVSRKIFRGSVFIKKASTNQFNSHVGAHIVHVVARRRGPHSAWKDSHAVLCAPGQSLAPSTAA